VNLHGDAAVADAIIQKKESQGAWQLHPDDENLKTYFAT